VPAILMALKQTVGKEEQLNNTGKWELKFTFRREQRNYTRLTAL
jgi:hypothetical protein